MEIHDGAEKMGNGTKEIIAGLSVHSLSLKPYVSLRAYSVHVQVCTKGRVESGECRIRVREV